MVGGSHIRRMAAGKFNAEIHRMAEGQRLFSTSSLQSLGKLLSS